MGVHGGPDIVEDGLIFAVDAGNGQSYVSGSATCVDMISNLNGTLINTVVYENINQGTWNFDGSDDYIQIGEDLTTLIPGSALSVEGWFKVASLGTNETIFSCVPGNSGAYHWYLRINDSSQLEYAMRNEAGSPFYKSITGGTTLVIDTWYHGCTTWDGSDINLYLNGISDTAAVASSFYISNYNGPKNNIGARVEANTSSPIDEFYGNISSLRYYNKALTAAEVLQNYNATKERFI